MLELGLLGFAQPWLLLGLATLPALWWLLRLTPPPPRRAQFPPLALLIGLVAREESAARMPWWLLALRMLIAALIILALAELVLAPQRLLSGSGPVVVVVDNGWASGPAWDRRSTALANILDEAERQDRAVTILPTALQPEAPPDLSFRPAAAWRAMVGALAPQPWATGRGAVLVSLEALSGPAEAFWLTDSLASADDQALAARLQRLGSLTVMLPDGLPLLLDEPEATATGFALSARRSATGDPALAQIQALAEDGRVIAATDLMFEADSALGTVEWTLPRDLANQVRQLRVAGANGAGSTILLDDRWQRRTVGLVAASAEQAGHPLLDPGHYIGSALADVARVEAGSLAETLAVGPSLIITRQRLTPDPAQAAALDGWLEAGGVLVRFAGPDVAATPDSYLPVRLRPASRVLGGALSWDEPQPLAAFPENSPFAGLPVPPDVTVRRQVLAEPTADPREKSWASLTDGTPLVTAEPRGKGWIALIHVTANADWSNLPLSGLFVDMLARLVRLGQGSAADLAPDATMPPQQVLDRFGRLAEPSPQVRPLPAGALPADLGPAHPPGYYGNEEGLRAWNLAPAVPELATQDAWPEGVTERSYGTGRSRDITGWLWLAAFVLLMADFAASLALRGHAPWRRAARQAAVGLFVLCALPLLMAINLSPAEAASDRELRATLDPHIGYIRTGDPNVDRTSASGLAGLSQVIADRTSIEPGDPIALDLEESELAFFPLIYWPITPSQPLPSEDARERIAQYLEGGGTILFDTRDQFRSGRVGTGFGGSPERQRLRQVLDGIRVRPLSPVPPDHVLTKAFYLLQEFPGRYAGGAIWVETNAGAARDGVSSVIIGGHDWAAAWALDRDGRPQFAVVPGGERQREYAYRFGVNLIMHVLTGNYKGDQVHVPSILDRLSQ
jgi:hypothetical protein